MRADVVAGIFVGGASRRMGRAKGLLLAPDAHAPDAPSAQTPGVQTPGVQTPGVQTPGAQTPGAHTLVARWRRLLDELGIEHALVGQRAEYASIELVQLADDPPGVGPLGGLSALLAWAGDRRALALACDMPFVTRQDLEALLAAPAAAVLVPRRDARWEPLCALYDPPRVLPVLRHRLARGERSLQGLLDALEPRVVELPAEHLDDWDSPQDVEAPRRPS